jgi:HD-GYP domain-containing protein (c-di-GMP phosphodiesterase class II)
VNPENLGRMISWFLGHAAPDASLPGRLNRLLSFFTEGGAMMKECVTAHCEAGEMFARRLGLSSATEQSVRYLYEQWDGKGIAFHRSGHDTPLPARILHLVQAAEVAHSFGGAPAATALAKERRGSDFDPDLVDALLDPSTGSDIWAPLDEASVQEMVLQMGPASSRRPIADSEIDDVCLALADLADIKARQTWHHSIDVADVATDIGSRLDPASDATSLRRAGRVHDIGKAGVPCSIVVKRENLTPPEAERMSRHARYSEEVLTRVPQLAALAPLVAAHHEFVDGGGYHRQLAGDQIPIGGRILRLADAYVHGLQRQPDPDAVLRSLRGAVGKEIDADCYEALCGRGPRQKQLRAAVEPEMVDALTPREVEVLQVVASGLSNRDVARRLVISEKTVEHHLEHIYDKLGVSCRASAVVFAVHNGLA